MMYARGAEQDEKVHKAFHMDYDRGIPLKGWREERVVSKVENGDRILLVLDGDPPAQKYKVNQVIKMMEKELDFTEDRLNHNLCKVYLFISSHRIAGCLVAEPIRTAHRVISNHSSNLVLPKLEVVAKDSKKSDSSILQFGQFKFQRGATKRNTSTISSQEANQWDIGAILCEEEALPAVCGIRAVWVAPAKRRKRIALLLLDAARKSFSAGQMLDVSQVAFSSPTSSGKAFASSYSRSKSFLIYREDDV